MKFTVHANRGKHLEDVLIIMNTRYRLQGRAVIHKVPTPWVPIRCSGKIVNAKVEEKAAVDFLGSYRGRAIAYDAKHTKDKRIRWDRVEPHQERFLSDWDKAGGIAFVLVGYDMLKYYLVPWEVWCDGLASWRKGKGAASVPVSELTKIGVETGQDYLKSVDGIWFRDQAMGVSSC